MQGTLIPVVGPSGAGKDTMIDAARIARPDIYYPTRVITRPESAGGEVFRVSKPRSFVTWSTSGILPFTGQRMRFSTAFLMTSLHVWTLGMT